MEGQICDAEQGEESGGIIVAKLHTSDSSLRSDDEHTNKNSNERNSSLLKRNIPVFRTTL